mmetsp:Transcript_10446/g.23658  ORF Transcript_10446/g.23658 Transcript_10446/m.23658 type:complete len:208 (+) Transcript_10446:3-626(+)
MIGFADQLTGEVGLAAGEDSLLNLEGVGPAGRFASCIGERSPETTSGEAPAKGLKRTRLGADALLIKRHFGGLRSEALVEDLFSIFGTLSSAGGALLPCREEPGVGWSRLCAATDGRLVCFLRTPERLLWLSCSIVFAASMCACSCCLTELWKSWLSEACICHAPAAVAAMLNRVSSVLCMGTPSPCALAEDGLLRSRVEELLQGLV